LQALVRDQGVTILLVTHKLPIVMTASHRVTVLRSGKVVARVRTADATEEMLVRHMIGRDITVRTGKRSGEAGPPVLQVDHLSAVNDKGQLALQGISFSLRAGEILGVAGVTGNGQDELAQVLAGLRDAASGIVRFDGRDVTRLSPLARWRIGMGYVPAERVEVASIAAFSLVENMALNYHFDPAFARRGLLDDARLEQLTQNILSAYDVKAPTPRTRAQHLSGGNLQKLVLGRVLSRKPRLLIAHLPTQGLDVEAAAFVRAALLDAKAAGAAVLLLSEDLDEILSLADWVAPIYEGRFGAVLPRVEADIETVGAMMAGLAGKEVSAQ
jgi:simple sugar transport system ATP-binding protein